MEIGLVTSSAPLCVSCLTICMLEMPHVMARCVIGTIFSFFVGPRRECLIFITILHPNCYRQDNCDREGLQAEKAGKIQENNLHNQKLYKPQNNGVFDRV